jgi:hypothetical protein
MILQKEERKEKVIGEKNVFIGQEKQKSKTQ